MIRENERTSMTTVRLLLTALLGTLVFACFAQPAVPQASIEIMVVDGVDHVKLSWEAVEDAESYNIYVSAEPYPEDWGERITSTLRLMQNLVFSTG